MKFLSTLILLFPFLGIVQPVPAASYDICIYGATSGGVIAAYTAKMQGKSVILIDPGTHLGGLSSGGLGFTDIGNKYVVSGLALDFYRRTGQHYGKFEAWIFEPHVASSVFQSFIDRAKIPVFFHSRLLSVKKSGNIIQAIRLEQAGQKGRSHFSVSAKVFIDCSYEGDLMAKAGVGYTTGREGNAVYHETYNGVQVKKGNQFPDGVDPYRVSGNPSSGLLWGVSGLPVAPMGSGDKNIQAYNYRICLTDDPANRIPITRPEAYDSTKYELLLRTIDKMPGVRLNKLLKMDRMPNHKTDINNNGGFSTDMIGMNWDYPEGDETTREKIRKLHEQYDKGLLYFIGHDPRVPDSIRNAMAVYGYPKDEYPDNGHWSPQLYVREARRMIGAYVMTQANCEGKAVVPDGIGMAAYGMDSHNTSRHVVNGFVKNEGDVQQEVPGPYPIAYRAIVPREKECANLLVPVCVSASHIAYGSIRMEPVFMVLSQFAASAAVTAINRRIAVQQVNVAALRRQVAGDPLADGSTPEIFLDDADEQQVERTGNWQTGKGDGYGPGYAFTATKTDREQSLKFTPLIVKSGYYRVYTYVSPRIKQTSNHTRIEIYDGIKTTPVSLERSDVEVQGQTSGEWCYLGRFQLQAGRTASLKISDLGADGIVVADAVLFKPDFSSKP